MQPIRQLMDVVNRLASPEVCLFTPNDLRSILPDHSATAFNTLLSRAARERHFTKICRGLYLYEKAIARIPLISHNLGKIQKKLFCILDTNSVAC